MMGYTATPYRYLFPSACKTCAISEGDGGKAASSGVTGAAGTAAGFTFGLLRFHKNEIKGR